GDGEDGVRGDRVVERRDLREAVPERPDVVVGGLDRPVLGQGAADEEVDRLRAGQLGRGRVRARREVHRPGGRGRGRGVGGGRANRPGEVGGARPTGRLGTTDQPEDEGRRQGGGPPPGHCQPPRVAY